MTGVVIQARMGSTRLPGKAMLESAGKPLLHHLVDRMRHSKTVDDVIVATSTDGRDDVIADYCASNAIHVFRGSENDVLDRYYRAAQAFGLAAVVRVCSDCPLIDPAVVDRLVSIYLAHPDDFDLYTNRHPHTFPDGCDVIPIRSLELVWSCATLERHREHVVPYFWETGMRVYNLEHPDYLGKRHRWTVDYAEDFELIDRVYSALYEPGRAFNTSDILGYLDKHPEVSALNRKYLTA